MAILDSNENTQRGLIPSICKSAVKAMSVYKSNRATYVIIISNRHSRKTPNINLHLPCFSIFPFLKALKSYFKPSRSMYWPAKTQSKTKDSPQKRPIAT